MSGVMEMLGKRIIFSLHDLVKFKTEAAHDFPPQERPAALAVKVHAHLDNHLEGIANTDRASVKNNVLSTTLAVGHYEISQADVFDAIFLLDKEEVQRLTTAQSWLSKTAQMEFSPKEIQDIRQGIEPSAVAFIPQTSTRLLSKPIETAPSKPFKILQSIQVIQLLKMTLLTLLIGIFFSIPASKPLQSTPITISLSTVRPFSDPLKTISLISDLDVRPEKNGFSIQPTYKIIYTPLFSKQQFFPYVNFDYFALKNYILSHRGGLIGHSKYFNQIISLAQSTDIDPLLLFAIIGQEQAFVPIEHAKAERIINNPFNVYNSWEVYNTSLYDSTQIAINTLKNQLSQCPVDADPLEWLNQTYAEDPNWHVGVASIYYELAKISRHL